MKWTVNYLESVKHDLKALGKANARRVLKVIDDRIKNGEPHKSGKALRGDLAGCRRIRTGDMRIVYQVNEDEVTILIIAVGPRKNIYESATKKAVRKQTQT